MFIVCLRFTLVALAVLYGINMLSIDGCGGQDASCFVLRTTWALAPFRVPKICASTAATLIGLTARKCWIISFSHLILLLNTMSAIGTLATAWNCLKRHLVEGLDFRYLGIGIRKVLLVKVLTVIKDRICALRVQNCRIARNTDFAAVRSSHFIHQMLIMIVIWFPLCLVRVLFFFAKISLTLMEDWTILRLLPAFSYWFERPAAHGLIATTAARELILLTAREQ